MPNKMHCKHCHGADATTHNTAQHSEDWVNLADARYTGEVIFMPASLIQQAMHMLIPSLPPPHPSYLAASRQWEHVDRPIIEALQQALHDQYTDEADKLGNQLTFLLENYPKRELED